MRIKVLTVKHQCLVDRDIQVNDIIEVLSRWEKKVEGGYTYCYLVNSQSDYNVPIVLYHNEIKLIHDN